MKILDTTGWSLGYILGKLYIAETRVRGFCAVILLIVLAGCAQPIHLHPIQTIDIIPIREGETLEAPKDGWFLSDMYLSHVMRASVGK